MKTRDVLLLAVVVFAATYLGNALGKPAQISAQTTTPIQKYEYKIVRLQGVAWNASGVCGLAESPPDKYIASLGKQGWQYVGNWHFVGFDPTPPLGSGQINGCAEAYLFMRPSN